MTSRNGRAGLIFRLIIEGNWLVLLGHTDKSQLYSVIFAHFNMAPSILLDACLRLHHPDLLKSHILVTFDMYPIDYWYLLSVISVEILISINQLQVIKCVDFASIKQLIRPFNSPHVYLVQYNSRFVGCVASSAR